MKNSNRVHTLTLRAILIACALMLSYIESQIPPLVAIPGIKLGLTNIVVLIALYQLGAKDAFMLNMVRIFIVGITFGNLYAMAYAFAGGMLSFIVMFILKKLDWFNETVVSIAGALAHNLGQIGIAIVILKSAGVLWYLPALWGSGLVSGCIIGMIGSLIMKRLPKSLFN